MNNISKQKLVTSFNQVVTAVHNLKTDIATEGRKAFMSESIDDLKELSDILNNVIALRKSIEDVAPLFKTYQIDLVTGTHPAEFPLESIYSGDAVKSEFPIEVFYETCVPDRHITCRIEDKDKYTLCAGSTFSIEKSKVDMEKGRIAKLKDTKLSISEVNDMLNVIVTRDISFTSLNSLMGFFMGVRVRNATKQFRMVNKPEVDLDKFLASRWMKP